jgi:hypothetical protein
MKFLCLIYNDPEVLKALPDGQADALMRECMEYDDDLRAKGHLVDAQILQPVQSAVTLRHRGGRLSATDGPFAETKEMLGGFQLIEARDMKEAIEIASRIPWTRTGSVEIRPVGPLGIVPNFP